MELAIPLLALGGMYVISNQNSQSKDTLRNDNRIKMKQENFTNMGIRTNLQASSTESRFNNYLPNTNVAPQNYPIMNNKELVDTTAEDVNSVNVVLIVSLNAFFSNTCLTRGKFAIIR